jgi:hypothetical protein
LEDAPPNRKSIELSCAKRSSSWIFLIASSTSAAAEKARPETDWHCAMTEAATKDGIFFFLATFVKLSDVISRRNGQHEEEQDQAMHAMRL